MRFALLVYLILLALTWASAMWMPVFGEGWMYPHENARERCWAKCATCRERE